MKFLIVALCAVSCVLAFEKEASFEILKSSYDLSPEGGYEFNYETKNGIIGQAIAHLKQVGKDTALEVQGQNEYISPEGQKIQLSYTADENGYHPQGAHLPTPPPPMEIPYYIQRAIEYIAAHPYVEKN